MNTLFDISPTPKPVNPNKCGKCKHFQRWECGGSIIGYCGKKRSNRTENKLMRTNARSEACELYEE